MIWGSTIASAFVIFVWVGYASVLVQKPDAPTGAPLQVASVEQETGFFRAVGNGIRIIVRGTFLGASNLVASVKNIFGQTHSIEIKGVNGGDNSPVPSESP